MSALFSPVHIGPYAVAHRVVMAPLTRLRAMESGIPGDLMVEHYAQRASQGGLIIAESTAVSIRGRSYLGAPGIYTDEQVAGWMNVVDAVHAKGGRIFLQMFHSGRQSHRDLQPGGDEPLAPSALSFDGMALTKSGWQPVSMPREMTLDEISVAIEEFRLGAARALAAGFDGVEIHGANGYLIDQFIQDGTNLRTDTYGGRVENRVRFLLDVTKAAISVFGADRVGVRLSPAGEFGGMADSNPMATFGYAAGQLNPLGVAYLHIIEPRIKGEVDIREGGAPVAAQHLRVIFNGTIIAAGGFDAESAAAAVRDGDADLVAFGRDFVANPDLPHRVQNGLPLNAYDRSTFYTSDHRGYNDYPFATV